MNPETILIKGAGEKASAVAHALYRAGFTLIVMTDRSLPQSERRTVCYSEALIEGRKEINGIVAQRTDLSSEHILRRWGEGKIAVISDPKTLTRRAVYPNIFIDAVMAKENTGTTVRDAPLVMALGPGFVAGKDCHMVVETNPNSVRLGEVIFSGEADGNTRKPTSVMGMTHERIIRAPADGRLVSVKEIGEKVKQDEIIGYVNFVPIKAGISGCLWGLVRDGLNLKKGRKIGDIDPRGNPRQCFEITPESRKISQGVLEGIRLYQSWRGGLRQAAGYS